MTMVNVELKIMRGRGARERCLWPVSGCYCGMFWNQ